MNEYQQPPQNPAGVENPAAATNKAWADIVGSPANTGGTSSPPSRKIIIGIIVLALAVLLGALLWYGLASRGRQFPVRIDNSATLVKPAPAPATKVTPLGRAAHGSGSLTPVSIKVVKVVPGPAGTGDLPDAGNKYVEIDLEVANGGKALSTLPGTFVYQTVSGSLLYTADSAGKGTAYPGKNVQIPGKEDLSNLSLKSGQANGSYYVVYQVPQADTGGKLIWYNGYYDTNSTKIAIFNLQ